MGKSSTKIDSRPTPQRSTKSDPESTPPTPNRPHFHQNRQKSTQIDRRSTPPKLTPDPENSPTNKCFISWGHHKSTKMDPYLQTSTPDRPPRMRRIRLQSKSMKPSMTSNPSAVRNRQKIYPKSTPNPQKIHPKLPRYIFIFFFKF